MLKDGRELHRRIPINKGAGPRALSAQDIVAKFLANATLWLDKGRAQTALDAVMSAGAGPVRSLMLILAGHSSTL